MLRQDYKNKIATRLKLIGLLLLSMTTTGWVADHNDVQFTYKEVTVEQLSTTNDKRKKPYER